MNKKNTSNDLLQRFICNITTSQLFNNTDKILLTVSGGVDSTVMAELFFRAHLNFGIAHCNFQLRGNDSINDAVLVETLAKKYKVPFHTITFDTQNFAKQNKLSIEEAARNLRYDFFEKIRQQFDYKYIATAHHNNDSIETFFINLIRGTGITGLHGILPKHDFIIRPLLPFSRNEIQNYATQNNIQYHEDYTNTDTAFLRNKIRHNLLPMLKNISPAIEQTMKQNINHLADVEMIYKNSIEEKRRQIFRYSDKNIVIHKDDITQLNPQSTYLFELLRPFGFSATMVNNLIQCLDKTSGKQFFSPTHTLLLNRKEVIISPKTITDNTCYIVENGTQELQEPIYLIFNTIEKINSTELQTSSDTINVDANKLQYPLKLRRWKQGDKFKPFGMKGTKKLSDFFKDQHLSLFEKQQQWILCNADDSIIWIIGMRMDDDFKINTKTKAVIQIKFKS